MMLRALIIVFMLMPSSQSLFFHGVKHNTIVRKNDTITTTTTKTKTTTTTKIKGWTLVEPYKTISTLIFD
jgi:hypothetical protein